MNGATLGAIICASFGGVWGVAGSFGLPRPWRTWVFAFSITLSAILIVTFMMHHSVPRSGTFRSDIYFAWVAFEAVGIVAAVWLLRRLRRRQFILPAIGFIVGVHFLGMWKATDLFIFVWTAIAMCIVAVIAALLPDPSDDGDLRRTAAGLGLAVVLWTVSPFVLS